MINSAEGKLESIQSVPLLYRRLFKKDYDFFDMLELSPIFMRKVGGIELRTFFMKAEICSYNVKLPCPGVKIQSVTDGMPLDWWGLSLDQNIADTLVINYNLPDKHSEFSRPDDFEQPKAPVFIAMVGEHVVKRGTGNFVDFSYEGQQLFFNYESGKTVDIIYRDIAKDKDGYPMIPEKAVEAFAYYLNFLEMQVAFNEQRANGQQMDFARQQKDQAIAQARTPSSITDNEMDELFSVLMSHGRTRNDTPYHP